MPRKARIVMPGLPHHVTQRGNRRQRVFFEAGDYRLYLDLAAEAFERFSLTCWAYCLMPNHVHLILEPAEAGALAAGLSRLHQRYTRAVNAREAWTGFLWQGRFASCAMDEAHALAAVRYVERNPVAARMVGAAENWPWSSAAAHVRNEIAPPLSRIGFLDRIADWRAYLAEGLSAEEAAKIGYFTGTGWPMGEPPWLETMEAQASRRLRPRARGRPVAEAREAE